MPAAISGRVLEDLRNLARATGSPVEEQIEERIDVFDISTRIQAGSQVDVAEALDRWNHRPETPNFAYVLHVLFRQPGADDIILPRACGYLENNPDIPDMTGPLFLALDVANRLEPNPGVRRFELRPRRCAALHRPVASGVRADADRRDERQIIELLLDHHVGDDDSRRRQIVDWTIRGQERDGLQKLPRLVAEGRHFLVLWHYVVTLRVFGVQTEPPIAVHELVDMSRERHTAILTEWDTRDRVIPPVIAEGAHGRRLSGEFIRYGRMLSRPAVTSRSLMTDALRSTRLPRMRSLRYTSCSSRARCPRVCASSSTNIA